MSPSTSSATPSSSIPQLDSSMDRSRVLAAMHDVMASICRLAVTEWLRLSRLPSTRRCVARMSASRSRCPRFDTKASYWLRELRRVAAPGVRSKCLSPPRSRRSACEDRSALFSVCGSSTLSIQPPSLSSISPRCRRWERLEWMERGTGSRNSRLMPGSATGQEKVCSPPSSSESSLASGERARGPRRRASRCSAGRRRGMPGTGLSTRVRGTSDR
mmetsp:Transcript_112/g.226  ORF Transcript_112/g.226 Transcript_112/m.226 type:complete len:216 (-) Transcript_112:170-817(-)